MDTAAAAASPLPRRIGAAQTQDSGQWPAVREQATNQSCSPLFPPLSLITSPKRKTWTSRTTLKSIRCLMILKHHRIDQPHASPMTDSSLSPEYLKNLRTYGEKAKKPLPELDHAEGIQLTTGQMAKLLTPRIILDCRCFDMSNHGKKNTTRTITQLLACPYLKYAPEKNSYRCRAAAYLTIHRLK